ncbi:ligase-associated DNA damage response endonuclease PdeM [Paracoccus sp. Z118]|uniref:ligase-associated DNA damage response endonuclease PdeM n=1 Tax=Paracoccus sp. Z118 TaxID=2851017 RepID=UPI001C2B7C27|nr:ligase-associated DNA damage response endonuclease PdeM [Paracoccus sp. Z118]MBV0890738.1 ligase-associated DNA damage response endonuclease PdeM [Paracoccus sp. Z118]
MTGFVFDWHGLTFEARCSGALWWPQGRWLIVADLHLGKSERMARRGGALLPPYDGLETLRRLGDEIAALDPALVVSLGDGFDDDAAAGALDADVAAALAALADGRDWLWVSGNHDPAHHGTALPGRRADEARLGGVTLRHVAEAGGPDISGHYHPVVPLAGARRRALLVGRDHLILPAFGSYTGGLSVHDPALLHLVEGGFAVACLHRALPIPLQPPRRRRAGPPLSFG